MNPWFGTIHGPRLEQVIEEKGDALKERYHVDDVYFAIWLHSLNRAVQRRILLSFDDLEDWGYADAYEAGMTPHDAAIDMLADLGYGDAYAEPLS